MADRNDVQFGYDASGFVDAMNKMAKSMSSFEKNTSNMTQKVSKGSFNAIAKAGILFEALKHGAMAVGNAMKEFIPEIGTAMDIAKNIVLKNLLWPLRQQLLPILNKILAWVRDNRKMFVELGGVLVNAFKMVKSVLMSVFQMVKPVIDVIKNMLKSIFGDTAKSVADTLNLVMLKIVVFAMMISNFVRPLFEGIAEVLKRVIEAWKNLVEGFVKGFEKVSGGMNIMTTLKDLLNDIAKVLDIVMPLIRALGEIMGGQIAGSIRLASDYLRIFVDLLKGQFNKDALKDMGEALKMMGSNYVKSLGGAVNSYGKMLGSKGDVLNVQDAIIRPGGQVIRTDPKDTIIATKHPGGMGGASVVIHAEGMHFTVTEGNAVNAGENFVKGLERQIKNVLLHTLTVEGN